MNTIDCRDMACPLPVVTVRRALAEAAGKPLRVLVDDGPPRENVSRYCVNHGHTVTEERLDSGYALVIAGVAAETAASVSPTGPTVLLVTSDRLGDGPEELGRLRSSASSGGN